MKTLNKEQSVKIFKQGSTTYFYSSFFFPKELFAKVSTLYAFVRVADDYVDALPPDMEAFMQFRSDFELAWSGDSVNRPVIDNFVRLAKEHHFEQSWIDAFLNAMQSDLSATPYETMDDLIIYMHGSAEVIGLMMNRIMGIDPKADAYASMLGRAMQYINFLRDLDEDNELQRSYLPQDRWSHLGVASLVRSSLHSKEELFTAFYRDQIDQYEIWNREGRKGLTYIPYRMRIAIKTASDLYSWTSKQIYKQPMIVFDKKIKPKKLRVLFTGLKNVIVCLFI